MRSITDLEAIIGPSRVPPPPVNWTLFEEGTGLVFPDDYKDWASRYSTLEFDEFLLVGHPGTSETPQEYVQSWADVLENMRRWGERFDQIELVDDRDVPRPAPPFPVYPAPQGLFPWGNTSNGDYCCWLTDPDPGKWTIVITTLHRWWHYPGTFTDVLVGLLNGHVRCPTFGPEGLVGATVEEAGWIRES
ncbi:SMI1/KNR4 family protein [Streptosporangium sp. NPDC020145]|uniref:SMI1/KNR4 family protein n=1 Tax=Streptosporangium sp. NPDC020145 TaxID=3154694 RepID=UPI00343B4C36